jgi:hypothetical protein
LSVSRHFHPLSLPPGSWFYWGDIYSDAGGLSRTDCERLLSDLRARPTYLNEAEIALVNNVTTSVEGRFDEVDVSDIVVRIRRLKPAALRRVLDELAELTERI